MQATARMSGQGRQDQAPQILPSASWWWRSRQVLRRRSRCARRPVPALRPMPVHRAAITAKKSDSGGHVDDHRGEYDRGRAGSAVQEQCGGAVCTEAGHGSRSTAPTCRDGERLRRLAGLAPIAVLAAGAQGLAVVSTQVGAVAVRARALQRVSIESPARAHSHRVRGGPGHSSGCCGGRCRAPWCPRWPGVAAGPSPQGDGEIQAVGRFVQDEQGAGDEALAMDRRRRCYGETPTRVSVWCQLTPPEPFHPVDTLIRRHQCQVGGDSRALRTLMASIRWSPWVTMPMSARWLRRWRHPGMDHRWLRCR